MRRQSTSAVFTEKLGRPVEVCQVDPFNEMTLHTTRLVSDMFVSWVCWRNLLLAVSQPQLKLLRKQFRKIDFEYVPTPSPSACCDKRIYLEP